MSNYEAIDSNLLVNLIHQAIAPQANAMKMFGDAIFDRTGKRVSTTWGEANPASDWLHLAFKVVERHNTSLENMGIISPMLVLARKYDVAQVKQFLLEGFLDTEQISRAIDADIDASMLKSITTVTD
jgi:hypothetical protein